MVPVVERSSASAVTSTTVPICNGNILYSLFLCKLFHLLALSLPLRCPVVVRYRLNFNILLIFFTICDTFFVVENVFYKFSHTLTYMHLAQYRNYCFVELHRNAKRTHFINMNAFDRIVVFDAPRAPTNTTTMCGAILCLTAST